MKVIFLDIDGVLNSEDWFRQRENKFGKQLSEYELMSHDLCKKNILLLNDITNTTHAKIVISSTWRKLNPLDYLRKLLHNNGVTGEIIDYTPVLSGEYSRGYEIQKWLDTHSNLKIESFVILDDDSLMHPIEYALVRTTWKHGLQFSHVQKCIEILNKKGVIECSMKKQSNFY